MQQSDAHIVRTQPYYNSYLFLRLLVLRPSFFKFYGRLKDLRYVPRIIRFKLNN